MDVNYSSGDVLGERKVNWPVISTEARMLSTWEPVQESHTETLGGTHWEIRGNGAELEYFPHGAEVCAICLLSIYCISDKLCHVQKLVY